MAKSDDLIHIENFNGGGLASSKWSGVKDSLYRLIGFDPHTRPGVLDVEQKLTKISNTTVDELCKVVVNCSNGSAFFFSSESGKIWEVTSASVVRLVHTTTPAVGQAKCLGACEYQGKIIWATQNKLHYITVANSSLNNWAVNAVEDWQTFGVGDLEFHPMIDHTPTLLLFIGDGHQVAQYDGVLDVFSADALDIRQPLRVKSLGQIGTDLLIGTYIASNVTGVEIIRWNTWDDSFSNSDPIPEIGINAFLPADNMVLVQAGVTGNIYYYDGTNLELYMKIPGEYTPSATAEVYPYSVANKEGNILFALSNITGNPAPQLIYRIGRHSRDYSRILDQPYPLSLRSGSDFVLSDLYIGGLIVQGSYILVAWKYGSTCGIDKLDATAKLDGAYWETRIMTVKREELTNLAEAFVAYASLPTGTALSLYFSKNYSAYTSALNVYSDTQRNVLRTKDEATEFTTLQLKVKATTTGNSAPLVESAAVRIR